MKIKRGIKFLRFTAMWFTHRIQLRCAYNFPSGLRTLCIAMAELEPEEFQRWSDIYYKASTSLENREKNVDDAAELIEKVSRLPIVISLSKFISLKIQTRNSSLCFKDT